MLLLSVALLITSSSAELLRKLERKTGRVLYVAAHPDDENTRLLTWLVRAEGARAAYLSLTAGEGGQNLIGSEQGPSLGAIRTQELLMARRIDGAEQFFGGLADFGYSKSPDEALRVWGKDRALAEVVAVIRRFRPDVIVTRFNPMPEETHGHHTASAILALEAFSKAADPKAYPEQQVPSWQATRIVWNRGFWDPPKPEQTAGLLAVDVGGFDPVLGESYTEIAARSRSMHKSQGFGATPRRGSSLEYFKLLAGAPMQTSLLDGIERKPLYAHARQSFKFDDPVASASPLAAVDPELAADCAGLYVSLSVGEALQVSGQDTKVTLTVINRSRLAMTLQKAELAGGEIIARDKQLPTNVAVIVEHSVRWQGDGATLTFLLAGQALVLHRPVLRIWNDPVYGERHAPVVTAPPVTVNPQETTMVFTDDKPRTLHVRVRASAGPLSGVLTPRSDLELTPKSQPYKLERAGAEQVLSFEVAPSKSGVIRFDGRALAQIDYPHIPPQALLLASDVKVVRFDLKKAGTRVGYLLGAGDNVAASLRQVGYDVTLLTLEHLEREPLERFDAIVIGVRAFNTQPRLAALKARLFAYVNGGGTLLVQYNTITKEDVGPYALSISHDRVTDETAPMKMLDPAHPVWSAPNRIEPKDFDGWVQERGLYFANKWDPRYTPLLAAHDNGEAELKGGLLVTQYGKGRFVYTGLSFFRQLPAGVSGAYRLFANLLAK